jgi:hypothetical protein
MTEIRSTTLCDSLTQIETSTWREFGRNGKPISPAKLARMLKPFEVYVTQIEDAKARGYKKSDFADAFERYGVPIPPAQSVKMSETIGREEETQFSKVSREISKDTLKNGETPTENWTSDTLTLQKGGIGSLSPQDKEIGRFAGGGCPTCPDPRECEDLGCRRLRYRDDREEL